MRITTSAFEPARRWRLIVAAVDRPEGTTYGFRDGSHWGSKGNAVRISTIRSRGCPRNCKRRCFRHYATGNHAPGKATEAVSREPGDLPSVVVTREHVGRGALTVAEPKALRARGETSFAVTCHSVPPEVLRMDCSIIPIHCPLAPRTALPLAGDARAAAPLPAHRQG